MTCRHVEQTGTGWQKTDDDGLSSETNLKVGDMLTR